MNKITTLLLTTILFAVVGCDNKKSREDEPNRYYSEANHFSILKPENWEVQENVYEVELIVTNPIADENDVQSNIVVTVEDLEGDYNTKEYFEASLQAFDELPEFKKLSTGRKDDFYTMTFMQLSEGQTFKQIIYVYVSEGRGYSVTGTTHPDSFDENSELFEEIAKSLEAL